ncbi:Flagellar hook-length control protein FliK [Pseudidiomarina woesei]|uniref:Flagellar hook-length control protein FliK n=1 Tax=Pseudidiomarina woesei TaxID=1381080 RepID=A0A0K6H9H3_9GAMM|nr:Flagellar hook-length control protein FliK [Pseudidiomarina woesei]
MSSITPLLDTLVHQVAKQRSTVDLLPRHTLPVAPIQATASTTEFSQAGQQIARLVQLIQSFQQQLSAQFSQGSQLGNQPGAQQMGGHIKLNTPIFPATTQLDALTLMGRLQTIVKDSGLFYEALLARWAAEKVPFAQVRQQPHNLGQFRANSPQIQQILGQQLELLNSGMIRVDTELWPNAHLQWLVQPDVNPLVQRWRDEQRRKQGEEPEPPAWSSELKLTLPNVGEIRAQMRLSQKRLTMQLQCAEPLVASLKEATSRLSARLRLGAGVEIDEIPVSRLPQ